MTEFRRALSTYPWVNHGALVLAWTLMGLILRLMNLTAKPPWMDEIATVAYSLGHGNGSLPINEILSLDQLLAPLAPDPHLSWPELIRSLWTEAPHPPFYFVLANVWMRAFPLDDGLVSVWATRTLPVLFGAAAIPASFGLGTLAFHSPLVGHLSALLMAFSPFGIAYAQEARHYSLIILTVILSLIGLVLAIQFLVANRRIPIWLSLSWILINCFGIGVHLFFILTLFAEGLVLLHFGFRSNSWRWSRWATPPWLSLYGVALGTTLGSLGWLNFVLNRQRFVDQLTVEYFTGLYWINPVAQALAALTSMTIWLPVEAPNLYIAIISGVFTLVGFIGLASLCTNRLKHQKISYDTPNQSAVVLNFTLAAITIFFFLSYAMAFDITRGFRYNFVYFPGVIILIGACLADHWAQSPKINAIPQLTLPWTQRFGRLVVCVIIGLSLLSAVSVVSDLGFRKFFRADRFLSRVSNLSDVPVLIASTVNRPDQIGIFGNDLISLGWHIKQHHEKWDEIPQFLLVETSDTQPLDTILSNTLATLIQPTELWLLYFGDEVEGILAGHQCTLKPPERGNWGGFSSRHWVCGDHSFE